MCSSALAAPGSACRDHKPPCTALGPRVASAKGSMGTTGLPQFARKEMIPGGNHSSGSSAGPKPLAVGATWEGWGREDAGPCLHAGMEQVTALCYVFPWSGETASVLYWRQILWPRLSEQAYLLGGTDQPVCFLLWDNSPGFAALLCWYSRFCLFPANGKAWRFTTISFFWLFSFVMGYY